MKFILRGNYKRAVFQIVCFILLFSAQVTARETSNYGVEDKIFDQSLGKVIREYNNFLIYENRSSPFGIAKPFTTFKKEYEDNLSRLQPEYRVRFLIAVLWHLAPTGGYLSEFEEIVMEECPNKFLEALNLILDRHEESQDFRVALLRQVKRDILLLLEHKKQ